MTATLTYRLRHRLSGDDGVAAILVCLFVVFIVIPVAGVAVDLSSGYANRRQMQNAADAAAQAGAQTMLAVRQGTASASSLETTVMEVAAQNGSDTSGTGYSCYVAKVTYTPAFSVQTGPDTCASWTGDSTAYNAVTVHTHHEVSTFFAGALSAGATSTSASASATATIQAVNPPVDFGNSVFAMCAYATVNGNGNGNGNGASTWTPLLVTVNGAYELNTGQVAGTPTAVGENYVVWSNAGGNSNISRCGLQSSSFDGLICGLVDPHCGQPISLPNWLAIDTGAQVGPTLATMAGYSACDSETFASLSGPTTFSPCAMVIPVCDSSNGDTGTNGELHCVAWGEFLLSPGDQVNTDTCTPITGSSQTICGEFLGEPQPAEGTPTSDTPEGDDPVRIALVQ